MPYLRATLVVVASVLAAVPAAGARAASPEAEAAVKKLRPAPDFQVELFAAEPMLVNPVCFWIDERGRFFVIETHRYSRSVYDIRGRMNWLNDDLASRTFEEMIAMHRKYMGDSIKKLTEGTDKVKLIEDREGRGVATHSTLFADGFNNIGEGLAAGIVTRGRDVYLANIPNLWLMKDADGKAADRKVLHTGYGVRIAFIGHDLHGLRFGPDGKLYFSLGDRGMNVKTPDGRHVVNPEHGAVLRCNADGSNLELFCNGLRNPQEIAFDKYGNLWTGDNNADGGDRARLVYLCEGSDNGWRIGYQTLPGLGPWNAERLWWPDEPAPYRVAPVSHFLYKDRDGRNKTGHGPSGFCYYPGLGLPTEYDHHFFMCDFPGGVLTWTVKPKGAGYEIANLRELVWNMWPTDVDFGYDGAVYVSDWIDGWGRPEKGRIFKFTHPEGQKHPALSGLKALAAEGMSKRGNDELAGLLSHPDIRIRQEAQFELAGRGAPSIPVFARVLQTRGAGEPLHSLHAVWGLGQIGAKAKSTEVVKLLTAAAKSEWLELRAQSAKVLGELRAREAADTLLGLLKDPEPRVRYFAAMSVGRLGGKEAVPAVLEMLRQNADADQYLRHAGVMALTWINDLDSLLKAGKDASPAVRMATLLAMRKLERPEAAMFLTDAEPAIVVEAVRAINDVPIAPALPSLAALSARAKVPDKALSRAVNAHYRLGTPQSAAALTAFALRTDVPEPARVEAIKALGAWEKPSGRDRVTGLWRPVPARDAAPARDALRVAAAVLLKGASKAISTETAKAAGALGVKEAAGDLLGLLKDPKVDVGVRVEALRALGSRTDATLAEAVGAALESPADALRAEAVRLIPRAKIADGSARLEKLAVNDGSLVVRQAAVAALAEAGAEGVLEDLARRMNAGKLPIGLHLEVIEAAGRAGASVNLKAQRATYESAGSAADPIAKFRHALEGGDAAAGRRVFLERTEAACTRCHKIAGDGGEVGPALPTPELLNHKDRRRYLLESIVVPNKDIAKGFEQVVLLLKDETTETGRIEKESPGELVLVLPDGRRRTFAKSEIQGRQRGKSAMPEDLVQKLSPRDLRDLVEFLVQLKAEKP